MMGINSIRNIVRKTFELIARPHRLIFKFPFLSLRLTHASFKYRSSGQSIVCLNEWAITELRTNGEWPYAVHAILSTAAVNKTTRRTVRWSNKKNGKQMR